MKLVRSSKGGTVQADQARRARAAQAVLAEITPFSPLITYPKTLPSFRKTFIREHQHFLTQTYSHPETYSQVEATSLQSRQTQTITTSANVFQTAMTMQRKSQDLFTAAVEGAPTCADAGTTWSYESVSTSDAPSRFLFHNISMTFR